MAPAYSDLQVVVDPIPSPQVIQEEKIAVDLPPRTDEIHAYYAQDIEKPPKARRICGLAPRSFWIITGIVSLTIIGAAVGGGVAGSLANKKSDDSPQNSHETSEPTPTISGTGPVSSGLIASVTTTDIPGPTITLHRDCPSSNDTIYDVTLGSSTMSFRKTCNSGFVGNGQDMVNTPVASLDECINLCAAYNIQNKTEIAKGSSLPCNTVCWRNEQKSADNEWPGQCFGFTQQNSSSGFVVNTKQTNCDSGVWINQEIL